MSMKVKVLVWSMLALFVFSGVLACAAAELDPEFKVIFFTVKNEERKLVLTAENFTADTNGVQTIRIFFSPGLGDDAGIRLHEVRAFADAEGKGPNVLLSAPVVGGPVHRQYQISWAVNGVGFPADMQPNEADKTGVGWGDKWYYADANRGVLYIPLSVPTDIKRIELEMGYTNKGVPTNTSSGIEISVSSQAFTEAELTAKMDAVLSNKDYKGTLVLPAQ